MNEKRLVGSDRLTRSLKIDTWSVAPVMSWSSCQVKDGLRSKKRFGCVRSPCSSAASARLAGPAPMPTSRRWGELWVEPEAVIDFGTDFGTGPTSTPFYERAGSGLLAGLTGRRR